MTGATAELTLAALRVELDLHAADLDALHERLDKMEACHTFASTEARVTSVAVSRKMKQRWRCNRHKFDMGDGGTALDVATARLVNSHRSRRGATALIHHFRVAGYLLPATGPGAPCVVAPEHRTGQCKNSPP